MMHERGKSASAIVATKPTNNAGRPTAEPVERRAETKGNADQQSTRRAQDRESVSTALNRIREVARERTKERFTALFHHISPSLLRMAFFALKRDAAPGVDGLTWRAYEADLDRRIEDLHARSKGERTGHCRPGVGTYRRPMAGSARSRSSPSRTRLSRGRRSRFHSARLLTMAVRTVCSSHSRRIAGDGGAHGSGLNNSAYSRIRAASTLSVLLRPSLVRAKSRIWAGLTTLTTWPASCSASATPRL